MPEGRTQTGGGHSLVIQNVEPEIDCGRYPAKRVVGDVLEVTADIFREGHGKTAAALWWRAPGATRWEETPCAITNPGLDRWVARLPLDRIGRWHFTLEAWADEWGTWLDEVAKKRAAGRSIALELQEGRDLLLRLRAGAKGKAAAIMDRALHTASVAGCETAGLEAMATEALRRAVRESRDRDRSLRYPRELAVWVDRPIARHAAWYEIMPRSQGRTPGRSATFDDCIARLPEIAGLGFDVVYLLPIHPIGRTHRKGPDNTLDAKPGDPGSPYAIGAREGGHTAIHPELGSLQDFRRFVAAAREQGLEVALDFAVQCSPDHPWIKQHPEWFQFRPDGTIRYAENPPKTYEDIVNVDFTSPARESLWRALRDVVLFWIGEGVTHFRVDNPHTKPYDFWEWLIGTVQEQHPGTVFLSEAFTRPRPLELLAKAGFTQSYSYFTWRNTRRELEDYLTELTQGPARQYLRPNFFANTPDILPVFLQQGGRAAFQIRLVLAATLSSLYGIYNGFELCEAAAVPGKEEYLHSEKYEFKVWDWDRPGHIKPLIRQVNALRHAHPALQRMDTLAFHETGNAQVIFYSKVLEDDAVLVAVNLDPFAPQECHLDLPLERLGLADGQDFEVEEVLSGKRIAWRGRRHHWRFDPQVNPAAVFVLPRAGAGA